MRNLLRSLWATLLRWLTPTPLPAFFLSMGPIPHEKVLDDTAMQREAFLRMLANFAAEEKRSLLLLLGRPKPPLHLW